MPGQRYVARPSAHATCVVLAITLPSMHLPAVFLHTVHAQRMSRGDEGLYEEAFMYGCPKFITPSTPAFDNPSSGAAQEVCTCIGTATCPFYALSW